MALGAKVILDISDGSEYHCFPVWQAYRCKNQLQTYGLIVDSVLVGVSQVIREPAELKYLNVAAPYRGMGYGRALVKHAQKVAGTTRLIVKVIHDNTPAIQLYKSLGLKTLRVGGHSGL